MECEKKSSESVKYKTLELYVLKLDDSVVLKGGHRGLKQVISGEDGASHSCNIPGKLKISCKCMGFDLKYWMAWYIF